MHGLGTDLRFAIRLFLRRPAVTVLALLTLSIGIGATTAIFSVVKPALLDALPYPNGDRLVLIWETGTDGQIVNLGFATLSDLAGSAKTVESVAAMSLWMPTLLGTGESVRLTGQRVGHRFFSALGVAPALGRDFTAEDDQPGSPRVAILSDRLFRHRFGSDPAVVGRTISLSGTATTIIGILPDGFESLLEPTAEIWRPLGYDITLPYACRTCRHLRAVARLAPGTTAAQATAELGSLGGRIAAAIPNEYPPGASFITEPVKSNVTKSARTALLVLFGAVGLVLILACVNVANLLLGQAVQRHHEFSVRMALGSGRARLARQVLLESSMLGLAGGTIAIGLAAVGSGLLRRIPGAWLPRAETVGLDWGVLGFASAVGILSGVGFGLLPALVSLESAGEGLKQGGGRLTRRRGARRALIVAEVTIASILVVGAGLLVKSMGRLLAVDPGFIPDRLLTVDIQVAGQRFQSDTLTWEYFRRVREVAAGVVGVGSAALTSQLPLGGNFDRYGVHLQSKPRASPEEDPSADRYSVTPGYFETMGIPLLEGRTFTEADRLGGAPVAVVNERYARLELGEGSPIGQRIMLGGLDTTDLARNPWRTIVGVVGNVVHEGLDRESSPQVYVPTEQWQFADGQMILVARTAADPATLGPAMARAVRSVDPDPTIERVRPMTAVIGGSTAARRLVLRLFQGFALVALGLAAVGIYGVMSSGVAERMKEFGIRSALGASGSSLMRSVIRESLTLGGAGIAFGLVVAMAIAPVFRGVIFDVGPRDLSVYLIASVILAGLTVIAALAPARRAARQDPVVALRSE
jgi:putative ABC transport system permease protein